MAEREMESTVMEDAISYIRRGWSVIPIPQGQKAPILKKWQSLRLSEQDVSKFFRSKCNVGVLLGEPSHNLIDIDLDHPEAVRRANLFLPATAAIFGRPGKLKSHRLYAVPDCGKSVKFSCNRTMICEYRSTGLQTVFPPSVHPSGEHIQWETAGEPATVERDVLLRAVQKLTDDVMLSINADEWLARAIQRAAEGNRNDTGFWLACQLRDAGIPQSSAESILARYTASVPQQGKSYSQHEAEASCRQAYKQSPREPALAVRTQAVLAPIEPKRADTPLKPDTKKIPQNLLNAPGILGDMVNWMCRSAFRPQPLLSLGASLTLIGTLMGRQWQSRNGRGNVFGLGLAPTGAGKDATGRAIKDVFRKMGCLYMLSERVTSDSAIYTRLESRPTQLFLWDEFAHYLRRIAGSHSTGHESEILSTLVQAYSSANSVMCGKQAAGKMRSDIERPHTCLWALAQPDVLQKVINPSMVADGFLPRVLVFRSDHRPRRQKNRVTDLPADLESFFRHLVDRQVGGLDDNDAKPLHLVHTPDAEEEATRWETYFDDQADAQEQWAGLWVRAAEHMERVALIVACCQGLAELDKSSITYSAQLVEWLIRDFISHLRHTMGENEQERDVLAVEEHVRKRPGQTCADIRRRFWRLDKRKFNEIFDSLCEYGRLIGKSEPGENGRTLTRYTVAEDDE